MNPIIKELIQRYLSDTPPWFKNIGYIGLVVAFICGSLLGQSQYELPAVAALWIDKIGMAASAVAILAFSAKQENPTNPENPLKP